MERTASRLPGPAEVSQRDFSIGIVCVVVLIVVAMAILVLMISHSGGPEKSLLLISRNSLAVA